MSTRSGAREENLLNAIRSSRPDDSDALRYQKRVNRDLKRHLTALTTATLQFLVALDDVMSMRSSPDRGEKIAKLSNFLDMANDRARYHGLGINFRDDDKEAALALADRTAADQFAEVLREWWSFNDGQQHTHSWHTREDFIRDELPKLLASVAQTSGEHGERETST